MPRTACCLKALYRVLRVESAWIARRRIRRGYLLLVLTSQIIFLSGYGQGVTRASIGEGRLYSYIEYLFWDMVRAVTRASIGGGRVYSNI